MTHALLVHCRACSEGYLLPRNLMGPLGARVTCPQCRESFDVDAEGGLAPAAETPSRMHARRSKGHEAERTIARRVLDRLAEQRGGEMVAAAREGRLFRDHGRELLEAFDDFRQRAGAQADAQAFREELRRRWQVDLLPMADASD